MANIGTPCRRSPAPAGAPVRVIGYGKTEAHGRTGSGQAVEAEMIDLTSFTSIVIVIVILYLLSFDQDPAPSTSAA